MPNPVTCEDCADSLPENEVSICSPVIRRGSQIQRLFITKLDANSDFTPPADSVIATSVNNPEAWSDRMDQTGQSDGAIITVHVIGSKARPEDTKNTVSLNRERVTGRKHTVAFKVDELNAKAHDFWRKVSKCGFTGGLWYETFGKLLFGHADAVEAPIRMSIGAGMVIPVEVGGIITWEGEATWEELGTENFIESVVPDAPEPTPAS